MKTVAVTGGIGSGKSCVCRLFRMLGCAVYDCDQRAKWLMGHSEELREALKERFGAAVYDNAGELDRGYLASVAFGDPKALRDLNGLVHPAVKRDMREWVESAQSEKGYVVVECAILFESGIDREVDSVVCVSANEEVRVERCMVRDGADREAVLRRVRAQMSDAEREERSDIVVVNDGSCSLLEQVLRIDREFSE